MVTSTVRGDDTPLMRQWRDVKSRHPGALVFFRVGDFFELFYQDAEEGARLLGLTLTSRNNGSSKAPLAGVPAKALDDYVARLVQIGRRVAVCDQVEDPAQAEGIVRREVTETITPGTVLQAGLLDAARNNFLVALTPPVDGSVGLAALDLSTGELSAQAVPLSEVDDELGRLEASEILVPRTLAEGQTGPMALDAGVPTTVREDWIFDLVPAREEVERRYAVQGLEGFGFQSDDALLIRATGALLAYVGEIRPAGVDHLQPPRLLRRGGVMVLDEMTRRNLELVEPLRAGEEGGTLLAVLDETVTPMGARMLRSWILRPLTRAEEIWERQEAVAELFEDPSLRDGLRDELKDITDLERIAGRAGAARVSPRELRGLGRSLKALPALREFGGRVTAASLTALTLDLDPIQDIQDLIERAIHPDAGPTIQEGGVIREGFDSDLDDLRQVRDGAQDYIAQLQTRERERTGISSLKVGFNKVFGYYLEVTKSKLAGVPDDYVRKQTLTNAERYFTPELKEWEEKVFGAEDRIGSLESELFQSVRRTVATEVHRIQEAARRVAQLDVLSALAHVAERRRYVRPEVHTGFESVMTAGRHPVVETMMPEQDFIPNGLTLDRDGRIVVLTGPNMAGKSTVLRQVGLIHLLAQMGAYVPADQARLPVCDRIFTRVGASDNLARGQSTFMVEMNETAAIVHGATDRSLVLLDEIGRGTSTYDGVSIAWAVTEYLHEKTGAKTVFATHYHELTQLGDLLPGVKNMNVAVREVGDEIVFLRRLEVGGADRSYGIQVARLAGMPENVVARAAELLKELEGTHTGGGEGLGRHGRRRPDSEPSLDQLSFFQVAEHPAVARLREVDPEALTPLEALKLVFELKNQSMEEDEV
jgi:DNA mismatch repair protein MutS